MESMDTFMSNVTYDETRSLLDEITNTNVSLSRNLTSTSSFIVNKQTEQSGIYTEFKLKTNDYIEKTLDINELIESYQNICNEHSKYLSKYQSSQLQQRKLLSDEQDELARESQLWHLLNQLYKDELSNRDCVEVDEQDENRNYVFKNEAKLGKSLTDNNNLLRRIKIIINWLEYNAKVNLAHVQNKISSFPEKCTSWEHTLHHLNNEQRYTSTQQNTTRDYVSELDPDAPIRQHKALHDLDQEDEYLIMEYIFSYIRAGDMDNVSRLCKKIGHLWRAATFEGFKLFNDFNYTHLNDNTNTNKLKLNEGNVNRDLWRLVVSKMIENDFIGPYEKAVYGSLAGFIRPVLSVCKTYYDYIWVYFKALYQHLLEKQLKLSIANHDYDRLVLSVDDTVPQSAIQIFDEINTLINSNAQLKNESQKPHSILLKKIIISGIDGYRHGTSELMDYIRTVISVDKYSNNGTFLRFASHLAVVFRFASFQYKCDVYNQIIEHYVNFLIDNKYKELIAFYLSQVPSDLQIKYYSKFLQTINNSEERTRLIKLAKSVNLNVQAITLNIVENLSKTNEHDLTSTTLSTTNTTFLNKTEFLTFRSGQILNEDDKKKINALDWIIHESTQRVKLLEYSNQVMRFFLLIKQNIDAVKMVLNKIPNDTLNSILNQYKCKTIDNLSEKIRNIIKEYICFKEYIEAISSFNEWFECYNQRPVKQSDNDSLLANSTISFSDRIAFDYQQKQYDDQLSKWNAKTQQHCDKAKKKFYNILTFPNGGWLKDIGDQNEELDVDLTMETNDEDSSKEEHLRIKQMNALRKVYIPYICFVLCELLSKSNLNKELLKLSDLIASELYKIYELFDVAQLKTLLMKLSNASIHLLDTKYDFLGY